MTQVNLDDVRKIITSVAATHKKIGAAKVDVDDFVGVITAGLDGLEKEINKRTISTADPCEPPEPNHEGKVPVFLLDGPCDDTHYPTYVKPDAENYIGVAGEDGYPERQLYEWEIDEDTGERKIWNDTRNPGKGVYLMRWKECLGY